MQPGIKSSASPSSEHDEQPINNNITFHASVKENNSNTMEAEEKVDSALPASTPTPPKSKHAPAHQQKAKPRRPENTRSCTEPTPSLLLHAWLADKDAAHDSRPASSSSSSNSNTHTSTSHSRNRSPYSRSHLRSRSTGTSALSAPPMMRAHSLPNPNLPRAFEGTTSPNAQNPALRTLHGTRSPRSRSPFKLVDESPHPPRSPGWYEPHAFFTTGGVGGSSTSGSGIESIQEDRELFITPRGASRSAAGATSPALQHPQPSPPPSRSNSLRSVSGSLNRRPSSPLYNTNNSNHAPASFPAAVIDNHAPLNMTPHSGSSSPALAPQQNPKYNETYPFALHAPPSTHGSTSSFASSFAFAGMSSSHPSTPSSARSRSPSISSLETIEDAPEAEETEEADAAAAIARLKLAAGGDCESDGEGGERRRSLDAPRGGVRRNGGGGGGEGGRKRWSVCGAERRADLDLETIWED